ncbi:MAG: methanethiol S-methyltransferase [Bacteroidota bacterium]
MKRVAVLVYGVVAYLVFFGTFLYLIGFTGNLVVPRGIDGELQVPLWQAILTNVALIALFGAQHSLMARSWFKKWFTQYIPEAAERSTFVLLSSVALLVLFYFWQPIGGVLWSIESPFLHGIILGIFFLGYTIVLVSSFLTNHFDLFGLRQVWLYFRKQPYTLQKFRTPFLYEYVRHPLYFGILLAFWSAPTMSYTRLLFALVFTIYVLKAIQWEEYDLIQQFGDSYRKYIKQVPKILPRLVRRKSTTPAYQNIARRKGSNL